MISYFPCTSKFQTLQSLIYRLLLLSLIRRLQGLFNTWAVDFCIIPCNIEVPSWFCLFLLQASWSCLLIGHPVFIGQCGSLRAVILLDNISWTFFRPLLGQDVLYMDIDGRTACIVFKFRRTQCISVRDSSSNGLECWELIFIKYQMLRSNQNVTGSIP